MLFFVYFFLGKKKVRIKYYDVEKMINRLISEKINMTQTVRSECDTIEITVFGGDIKALENIVSELGAEYEVLSSLGLPSVFEKYKKRYGIYIGAVLFFLIVYTSTMFVWRIDVVGNEGITREEIIALLKENGVKEGSFIPTIDVEYVQHRSVLDGEKLAWLSLNRIGTIFTAEVKEKLSNEKRDPSAVNIVATFDGQIDSIEVYEGEAVVNIGDSVKKGDLLISGIVDGNASGLREICADGTVIGRVSENIHVEIPFENTEKRYTGKEIRKNKLIFFRNYVNLFINSRISIQKYDTIISRKVLELFDGTSLPMGIETEIYKEYEEVSVTYTQTEAAELAIAALNERVMSELDGAQLLSRTQSAYFTEYSFVIDCELYMLKNIAEVLPIG